jgi:hypothetical protein
MKPRAGMNVEELNRLYEDLYVALGPDHGEGRERAIGNVEEALKIAGTIRIERIVDPMDAPGGGGKEASARYKLYRDGQTVAAFIREHGDSCHLRLDVQRGNIKLIG